MSASSIRAAGRACRPLPRPMRRRTRRWRRRCWPRLARGEDAEARIDARARRLVESIRAHAGGLGGIEDFLHAYSLSTKEGLALMVLAEALLRVPDAATADALIEDKLAAGDWSQAEGSGAFLVSASAWTLGHHRARHPARRDAGEHRREHGQAARPADGAARDAAGDAAARLAFRAGPDHRGGAVARRLAPRVPLFVRHAGRGRAHRGRRRALFRRLCRRHRRDRRARRQRGAAGAAGHFRQALGAASALRGGVARARAGAS